MFAKNRAVVRFAIEEIFNQKKAGLIATICAPDYWGTCPDGAIQGRPGIKSFLERYAAAFPDFRLFFEYMIAEGDRVVVPYVFVGTNTGLLEGFPPTGCVVNTPGIVISRIMNNWIIEQHFVWDNLRPRHQIWPEIMAEWRSSKIKEAKTSNTRR